MTYAKYAYDTYVRFKNRIEYTPYVRIELCRVRNIQLKANLSTGLLQRSVGCMWLIQYQELDATQLNASSQYRTTYTHFPYNSETDCICMGKCIMELLPFIDCRPASRKKFQYYIL